MSNFCLQMKTVRVRFGNEHFPRMLNMSKTIKFGRLALKINTEIFHYSINNRFNVQLAATDVNNKSNHLCMFKMEDLYTLLTQRLGFYSISEPNHCWQLISTQVYLKSSQNKFVEHFE